MRNSGRLAQLARALRLHRRCRGFESLIAHLSCQVHGFRSGTANASLASLDFLKTARPLALDLRGDNPPRPGLWVPGLCPQHLAVSRVNVSPNARPRAEGPPVCLAWARSQTWAGRTEQKYKADYQRCFLRWGSNLHRGWPDVSSPAPPSWRW